MVAREEPRVRLKELADDEKCSMREEHLKNCLGHSPDTRGGPSQPDFKAMTEALSSAQNSVLRDRSEAREWSPETFQTLDILAALQSTSDEEDEGTRFCFNL